MKQKLDRTALYCRLSKDDDVQGDSESIKTQKTLLTQYAKEHGFLVVDIYADDGYSGLNFDRPGFNQMIEDIENGKIDVVITKDLSRLGRDHLKVGFYTEMYFPSKRVRYIAINDNVDTENNTSSDFAALKNVMNEFYSRDNSRKIRSSIKARAKAGLYRASFSPIGYRKAPDNHNRLIIDEETAWIVRKIFELASQGWGAHRIRTYFEREQVPCPSWWLHQRGEKRYTKRFENPANKYIWSHTVISNIIKNPLYLGHTVMCKSESIFKVGLQQRTPQDKWIVVENTHEPLVSQEVFDFVNEKIKSRKREDTSGNISIFSGLIKCGSCGKALSQRFYTKKKYKTFMCTTYAGFGADKCTEHRVFYDDLYNVILKDIRSCAKLAFYDEEKALKLICEKSGFYSNKREKEASSQLKAAEKRMEELNRLFEMLYEDSLSGCITKSNFDRMIAKYQREQAEVEQKISELSGWLKSQASSQTNAGGWIKLIRKYVNLQELTAEILNELVTKIVVHERRFVDGTPVQDIEVHYRFVGLINETEYRTKVLQKTSTPKALMAVNQ
ncbi:MAG TPA: recombinase family protein [Clostridiaceae bacterium]|nr:recombinase family protein [Clostridiaceae bacterium]